MKAAKIMMLLLTALLSTAPAVRAEWTSRRDVARAAHALSERAEYFQRIVHWRTGYAHLEPQALQLAVSIERMRQNIERGLPYQQAVRDLAIVEFNYERLRRTFALTPAVQRDPFMVHEWNRVAELTDVVMWTMGMPI
jgi:hypothetical protein